MLGWTDKQTNGERHESALIMTYVFTDVVYKKYKFNTDMIFLELRQAFCLGGNDLKIVKPAEGLVKLVT